MNNPIKSAFKLAQHMRNFRAEMDKLDQPNPCDAKAVDGHVDWIEFADVIEQLEFHRIQNKTEKQNGTNSSQTETDHPDRGDDCPAITHTTEK